MRASAKSTEASLGDAKDQTLYNTVVSLSTVKEHQFQVSEDDILHPPDTADATAFPGPLEQAELMSGFGVKVWTAGGKQNASYELTRNAIMQVRNGDYFPVVTGPVFATGNAHKYIPMDIPNNFIDADATGLTLNFWFQQLEVNRSDSFFFYLYTSPCKNCMEYVWDDLRGIPVWRKDTTCPANCIEWHTRTEGFWIQHMLRQVKEGSPWGQGVWIGDNPQVFPDGSAKPDEKFCNARRSGEVGPVTWRMLTIQLDKTAESFRSYLDGKLEMDSRKGVRTNPNRNILIPDWVSLQDFNGGFIRFEQMFDGRETHKPAQPQHATMFRVADARLYPRALNEAEVEDIHLNSKWPVNGEWPPLGPNIRQV